MKKQRTKLAVALLALACAGACVGAGVAYAAPTQSSGIVAQAETTYTINAFDGGTGASNASTVYAYCEEKAWDGHEWPAFEFVAGSGNGFTWNGNESISPVMKWAGQDFYIELGREASEGDYFTVDGTFYVGDEYVQFNGCALQYKGGVWVAYQAPEAVEPTYVINAFDGGTGASNASTVYAYCEEKAWDGHEWPAFEFVAGSGNGFTWNGNESISPVMKWAGQDFYIELGREASEGDYFTVDGIFYVGEEYVQFNSCKLQYKGGAWVAVAEEQPEEPEVPEIQYTEYNVENLIVHMHSRDNHELAVNTSLWLHGTEDPSDSWSYFTLESGEGFKVNGVAAELGGMQNYGGGIYLKFEGVNVGDVISISGTYVNSELATKYIIKETKVQFTETGWVAVAEEAPEEPEQPEIEYTTHEIGALKLHPNSTVGGPKDDNSVVYLARADKESLPVLDWTKPFVAENAANFKINGEAATLADIKSTADGFYWSFGKGLNAGDVITIEGTFACESAAVKYVISESKFVWNGRLWENYVEYTTHEIGKLTCVKTDLPAGKVQMYFARQDGEAIPIYSQENNLHWDTNFYAKYGVGITLNGVEVLCYEENCDVKYPSDMFIEFRGIALNVGDELVIGGTFYSTSIATQYVIEESKFTWNGTAWVGENEEPEIPDVPVVNYTEYKITEIGGFNDGSAIQIYATDASENALPKEQGDWDNVYTFEAGSGAGITLNGVAINVTDLKQPGDFFIGWGMTANEGDIFVIDGTYYNEAKGFKFIFENCSLKFTDGAWVTVSNNQEPEIEYSVYTVTSIGATKDSTANVLYVYTLTGDELPKAQGDWDNMYALEAGSGSGLTLNGEVIPNGDIKFPGDFFVQLGAVAEVGDIVTLDGAYYNEWKAIKLVFVNCSLKWNGAAWETYGEVIPEIPGLNECEEYTLGALVFHHMEPNSLKMAHFAPASGEEITLKGEALGDLVWNTPFTFLIGSGAGIKLNDNAITPTIKYPQYMFVELANNAKYGDVITIGGTFYNLDLKVKYVVEESSFIWNGREWQANDGSELPPEPDAPRFEVNKLGVLHTSTESVIHAYPIAGDSLNIASWDYAFLFTEGTGAGLLINGEEHYGWEMKQPGTDLYLDLRYTPQAGDILTLDGEFISYAADATIIFNNCQLYYNGIAWETYVAYDYTEVGAMIVNRDDPNTRQISISLLAANGAVLPVNNWDHAFEFRAGSGVGAVYQAANGDVLYPTDIKAPGGQWYVGFLYNGEWRYAEEGDIFTIGGTFVCPALNAAYVITESTFIYQDGTWINEIDGIKAEAVAELDAYATNFAEANYYEAEWKELAAILSEGKDNINNAMTKNVVAAALEAAKAAMDDVATKTESDEILATLPAQAKAELAAYKNEADYRAAEWAQIQDIIATANAEIDAGTSVTAIKKAVAKAKAAIDALHTAAQWDAAEAVVANAKAELAAYKSEADYRAQEWAQIQEIIAKASVEIDSYIFHDALIAEVVADAKASMDKIFTAEEANAADAVISAALAELAGYKAEANYYDNEWTEIQIIIANAATAMEKVYGDSDATAAIVVEAKSAIDEVKTKDIVDAENFAAAKEAAINEVIDYYGALDHSRYTDEAEAVITGYMEMVMEELEAATTYEALEAAVAQFKANVEDVEMLPPVEKPEENDGGSKKKGGCGSLVAGGLSAGVALAAAAAMATLRKKKED